MWTGFHYDLTHMPTLVWNDLTGLLEKRFYFILCLPKTYNNFTEASSLPNSIQFINNGTAD